MAQDNTKKEALFNEVKGSLFEYLVAKQLAVLNNSELSFHESLDKNYLNVLSQQDRMVRQFYPEMLQFLNSVSKKSVDTLVPYLKELPSSPKLMGKFINSSLKDEINEADLLIQTSKGAIPLSLKLNKKNAFVNTKSGGIKSFFSLYFPFLSSKYQQSFNQRVDMEFERMAIDLHALHDLEYPGSFSLWVKKGFSELPGELSEGERKILKNYYARLAKELHAILSEAQKQDALSFGDSLAPLMGFSSPQILQLVCFHDFKSTDEAEVLIHPFSEISQALSLSSILPFGNISSVEIDVGEWQLQIRIKPMNKFTTTAIKINCSVKVKPRA